MTEHDEKLREAVALFRYGLIADLVHVPRSARGMGGKIREKAAATHTIPGTHRTRVAAETILTWLTMYRYGGFEAVWFTKCRWQRSTKSRLQAQWRTPSNHEWLTCARDVDLKLRGAQAAAAAYRAQP